MNVKKLTMMLAVCGVSAQAMAAMETDIGMVSVDLNLRYEGVSQDNALEDANALTLRTKANFTSKSFSGFMLFAEVENTVAINDEYNDTLGEGTQYSVVADPETTELDQAYLQFVEKGFSAKLGRQVITLDNHRFVGHVGWRQDKQTFDALRFNYKTDTLDLSYAFIDKRNRIFADERDIKSSDHLVNLATKTAVGKLTAYGYFLELDQVEDNRLDTLGVRMTGSTNIDELPLSYAAEVATQSNETAAGTFDTNYYLVESAVQFSPLKVTLGYEVLGSDAGQRGFATPLATLHKFNGWADQFLATPNAGLKDTYLTFSGKAYAGKWALTYHDYSADRSSAGLSDFGNEINALYVRPIDKTFTLGVKYAAYSAGDQALGKVDTDKLWVWANAKF